MREKNEDHNQKYIRLFTDTDLSRVVGSRGVAVSVPYHYLDSDVATVLDAIIGRPVTKTTPKTVPTPRPTTTTKVPPSTDIPRCLVVGDLYNFGSDADKYYPETELVGKIGYDFLLSSGGDLELALWAYGYTQFSKTVNDSLKAMRRSYEEFEPDLHKLDYTSVSNPWSSESAINAINEMYDSQKRVNCLVFFSAQGNPGNLPKLNPKNTKFSKIIAVGFNNVDLQHIVPAYNGFAFKVPFHYLDEDITPIVKAMLGRYVPKTTVKPVTTKKPITTEPPPSKKAFHCLFAGDLFNYGHSVEGYDLEADLMDAVSHDLFEVSPQSSLGLWAYGYTNFSKNPATSLSNMRRNYVDFQRDLIGFGYVKISDPLATKGAIEAINAMRDNNNRINCLVFYSSTKSTSGLPKINPQYLRLEKIVAVGLNDAWLRDLVPSNGIVVSVPKHFLDDDVALIVNAIMRRPTTRTSTTRRPTTTTPARKIPKCLFTGDLYNYGEDLDSYELEGDLMEDVAYDLFKASPQSSLGLWAFGYTNFPKDPSTSLGKMRRNYLDFEKDLLGFDYVKISDPLSTKAAIEALNAIRDDEKRFNCLVFFSSKKNVTGLPKIDPKYLELNKVVAVGLDYANLETLIPSYGVDVMLPKRFVDTDVERVINAIMKR
ncbi:hypothetical protein ANCCAN_01928 [Ancylostoma caninum]|uniref:Uncharacterized protein n=1 Tax=Ancylostoma caninum TaxID=29170 RepID=A0A368H909_ANCCA|nr:hypothetical protein ANCCAN_01928 [Ancylostoma caninum]